MCCSHNNNVECYAGYFWLVTFFFLPILLKKLKDMAERLPVGAARDIRSPSFTSFGSNLSSSDVLLNAPDDLPNGQMPSYKEPDLSGSNTQLALNGSSTIVNRSLSQNKVSQSEATARNGSSRSKDGESRGDDEWVEQDEPGVYITLSSLPGGIKDLKRVRFRYAFFFFFSLKVYKIQVAISTHLW